jgi:hypothetical protein
VVEIGGVAYVVRSGPTEWRRAWHRRRASRSEGGGVPARRLDFVRWFGAAQRAAAGSEVGGESAGGAVKLPVNTPV